MQLKEPFKVYRIVCVCARLSVAVKVKTRSFAGAKVSFPTTVFCPSVSAGRARGGGRGGGEKPQRDLENFFLPLPPRRRVLRICPSSCSKMDTHTRCKLKGLSARKLEKQGNKMYFDSRHVSLLCIFRGAPVSEIDRQLHTFFFHLCNFFPLHRLKRNIRFGSVLFTLEPEFSLLSER